MRLPLKEIFESNAVRNVFIVGCFIVAALLIFEAGVHTGMRKSTFAENPNHFFVNQAQAGINMMGGVYDRYVETHGAFGTVVDIDPPVLILADRDGSEKAILVGADTLVRRMQGDVDPTDISVGDTALVIGSPNDAGEIQAELIRLLPPLSGAQQ